MTVRDGLKALRDERAGKREQTVLTGEPILALLLAFWGRTALDPCAPPEGPVRVACDVKRKKKHPDDCKHCGGLGYTEQRYTLNPERAVRLPENGLQVDWPDRTFCNPPYADLAPWLAKPGGETIWYVPSRSNRIWWRAWSRGLTELIALNPQKFKGYTAGFPAPLVLGYRGTPERAEQLARLCSAMGLGDRVR
ncbi:MAG: hypothetical protein VYA51_12860 [Planctomycetota bacterium]|nr:hypothetical protein [Planctomycetota bacterium]